MTSPLSIQRVPLAHQLRRILLERIREGVYPPESQLPPEHELAAEFNVSRTTVRSAIAALSARGLIVHRHGVGNFVSRLSRVSHPLNEAMDFDTLIRSNGCEPHIEFVSAVFTTAGRHVAEALQISHNSEVLRTEKIFAADGEPVVYCVNSLPTSLFSPSVLAAVRADPTITEPLFDFLETHCQQRIEYHIAVVQAKLAEQCRFRNLRMKPETPLLSMEEVGYNEHESPVWHSFEYYPGHGMTFELIRWRNPLS